MKLVMSLHCCGSRVGRLTYYREKVEQVLPGLVSDLLRVEAEWRSHDGLSMDKGEISGWRANPTGVAFDFRTAYHGPPTEEERVGGELASCLSQVAWPHPALACLPDAGSIDKQNASIRSPPFRDR